MNETNVSELAAKANEALTDPERNRTVGDDPNPRFELYHMAFSLCSHKVRTTLAEKRASYTGHDMIFPVENYAPDYVRLRLKGGEQLEQVSDYTGRSSTTTEGFDPCVVPTLVDHEANRVIIDSKAICEYINETAPGVDLVPDDIAGEVLRQVEIVDGTPHVAVLYGKHPGNDTRPAPVAERMEGVHARKCEHLGQLLEEVKGDEALERAYRNKITKETAAAKFIATPEDMQNAIDEIAGIIGRLDADLEKAAGDWICGERYTLADICWGVSLFRLKWLGLGWLWEDDGPAASPRVEAYTRRLMERPGFREAVIEHPGVPPSPHLV